jgi:H+/Cl- antiporter ClcA
LLLLKYLAPGAEGHGTEKVIEAVRRNGAKVRGTVVPVKLAATLVTITAGGSVGKEGPCARIGAGLSSLFADLLRFEGTDRVKLVVCGISAGFASVFGAPVAGAVFGIEVLYVGRILYDVMLPSFISGIVAYQVASALGVSYFTPRISVAPVFGQLFFVKVILSGVFFGLCSSAFIEFL